MDIRYNHPSFIHVLRACQNDDAADLIALGGDHSVDILLVTDSACQLFASFHIGSNITALAWSPTTVSPTASDDWLIELAAASADFGLQLITKSSANDEQVFPFGGGLSGHHGKVNDMAFCGGLTEDGARYVATVSDDKMLMVWDLHPTVDVSSSTSSASSLLHRNAGTSLANRPQPTAYVIAFPHPLISVSSHPSTSKEFLVSDCQGSIFLTDWRSDRHDMDPNSWRHSSLLELVEPHALAESTLGSFASWSGSAAWRRDSSDMVGAVYGPRFSIWDISNLHGGKPNMTGVSFPEGGHRFRWCHTYPEYFGISAQLPDRGAVIHVHNINYIAAQPTVFNIRPKPHTITDFDFLSRRGIPRIAAAIGRTLIVFSIGVDG